MRCEKCNCRFEDKDDLVEKRHNKFQTTPWFIGPKSKSYTENFKSYDKVKGVHIDYDNFSDISSDVKVFKFYEYFDKSDSSVTIARTNIEEREWIRGKWKWLKLILKYLPNCQIISRRMEITFRDEVGSRKSSWKGGTTGMSFDMKKNETLDQCWDRFIREYKFR